MSISLSSSEVRDSNNSCPWRFIYDHKPACRVEFGFDIVLIIELLLTCSAIIMKGSIDFSSPKVLMHLVNKILIANVHYFILKKCVNNLQLNNYSKHSQPFVSAAVLFPRQTKRLPRSISPLILSHAHHINSAVQSSSVEEYEIYFKLRRAHCSLINDR